MYADLAVSELFVELCVNYVGKGDNNMDMNYELSTSEKIVLEEVKLDEVTILEEGIQPGGMVCGLSCLGGAYCGVLCYKG